MDTGYQIFIDRSNDEIGNLPRLDVCYCSNDRTKANDFRILSTGLFVKSYNDLKSLKNGYSIEMFLSNARPVFKNCQFYLDGHKYYATVLYHYDGIMLIRLEDGRITALNGNIKYYSEYHFSYLSDAKNYPPEKILDDIKLPLRQALALEKISKNGSLTEEDKELVKNLPTKSLTISEYLLMHNYSFKELKLLPVLQEDLYEEALLSIYGPYYREKNEFSETIGELDELFEKDPELAILITTSMNELIVEKQSIDHVLEFLKSENYSKFRMLQVVSFITKYTTLLNSNNFGDGRK